LTLFTTSYAVFMAVMLAGHATTPTMIATGSCDASAVAALPLIERPATTDTGQVLVLLLTGDGGWAGSDEGVSRALQSRGAAVIGLNMRSYLSRQRSPDELARDVTCIVTTYLARWRRPWLMLLGYSRGADLAPFAASRLSPDVRRRITTLTLVSPSQWAGFRFHLIDLIRDVHRPDDLPVLPELEKLSDLSIVCISGRHDPGALCPALTGAHIQVITLEGGHRITGGYETMATWLEQGLRPPLQRPP
jgi:peptidoglycan-N-acetylglucosamine deacetylase